MRKLAILTAAAALVAGFGFAGTANAGPGEKGIYEAPMMDSGGEVDDSEGKIERNGDYKVEIEPVADDRDYDVCLVFDTVLGGTPTELHLETVTVDDGETELKSEGDVGPDDFYGPQFRVYDLSDENATAGDCASDTDNELVYQSGLTTD